MKRIFKILTVVAFLGVLPNAGFAADLKPYSEQDLNAALESKGPVLLAFHSASCSTCKKQGPLLDALLNEKRLSSVVGLQVNFETESALKKRHRVSAPSTLVLLKDGKEIARSTGQTDVSTLRSMIDRGV